jgi:hypothetical protein
MNMKTQIDPIQLQRLIDGECRPADVRAILLAAKTDPACWEQISLALLEDRTWQCKLQTPADSAVLDQPSMATFSQTESQDTKVASSNLSPSHRAAPFYSTLYSTSLLNWVAMAASLIVVAFLGYSIGQQNKNTPAADPQLSVARVHDDNPGLGGDIASPQTTLASLKPDYRMQLPAVDPQTYGYLQPSGDVPMYVVRSMDQWRQLDQPQQFEFSPEELAELNLRGIGLQKDFNVISGKFDDGRVFVVPIRSIRLAPWQ